MAKQFLRHMFTRSPLRRIVRRYPATRGPEQWTAHDQKMLEFYRQFVSPGSLCFDVGANTGNRVKVLLRLRADVVAVEPQAECAAVLRATYGGNRRLVVVEKALGDSEGKAEMMVSKSTSLVSSLSPEWVEAVQKSGRFGDYSWDTKQVVSVTTLDSLIEEYGRPTFVKIDVEGFEYPVVRGLSQPVRTLSLEFTPEFIESTFRCLDYLEGLGDIRLNYSLGETMQLVLARWVTRREIVDILSSYGDDAGIFGDVYVQLSPARQPN